MTKEPKPSETRQAKYKRTHPWVRFVEWARRRCNDRSDQYYKWYGAKGVCCLLSAAEAHALWNRDGAAKLRRPSLDRIDSDGHYELGNCRFIEFDENVRLAHAPKETSGEDLPDSVTANDEVPF